MSNKLQEYLSLLAGGFSSENSENIIVINDYAETHFFPVLSKEPIDNPISLLEKIKDVYPKDIKDIKVFSCVGGINVEQVLDSQKQLNIEKT
jgi:hypothetical protein